MEIPDFIQPRDLSTVLLEEAEASLERLREARLRAAKLYADTQARKAEIRELYLRDKLDMHLGRLKSAIDKVDSHIQRIEGMVARIRSIQIEGGIHSFTP